MDSQDRVTQKLADFAKLWLAHDGLWFQVVEEKYGLDAAIELDKAAWFQFSPIEAKRIMTRLGIEEGGGLQALVKALPERLYAELNEQEIIEAGEKRVVFVMKSCRVQEARRRRKLAPFPCKEVGIVEYSRFASTIDPRIRTKCLRCPPDDYKGEFWCAWEFTEE